MLERYCEAGATRGPIEQEEEHSGCAESILALADGKAHLVGLNAKFLGEGLTQRDDKLWRRRGAGCAAAEARSRQW